MRQDNNFNKCVDFLIFCFLLQCYFHILVLKRGIFPYACMRMTQKWRKWSQMDRFYYDAGPCSYIYTGRWFFGCPTYQSGPRKNGFRIDRKSQGRTDTRDTRKTIGLFYNRKNIRRDKYTGMREYRTTAGHVGWGPSAELTSIFHPYRTSVV